MSDTPQSGDRQPNADTRERFFGAAIIAVLALLVFSNVLLWQLVRDDDDQSATANRSAVTGSTGKLPALPGPTRQGTSRQLLRELDKTRDDLSEPMQRALDQLDAISAGAGDLSTLYVLLEQMVAQTAQLADAAPALESTAKRLKKLDKQFKKTADSLESLGPVLVDLEKTTHEMADDLDRIRQCTEAPSNC